MLLLIVPKALNHFMVYVSGAESGESLGRSPPVDSSLLECNCLFIIMFRQTAERVLPKRIIENDFF